jgi:hypothetical protein
MADASLTPGAATVANTDKSELVDGRCSTRFAIFSECPHCGGPLHPEHAHFKCAGCGWRDSCCD